LGKSFLLVGAIIQQHLRGARFDPNDDQIRRRKIVIAGAVVLVVVVVVLLLLPLSLSLFR
jgi:uncharacterized membrane protein YidH (DUF202 family)